MGNTIVLSNNIDELSNLAIFLTNPKADDMSCIRKIIHEKLMTNNVNVIRKTLTAKLELPHL